MGFKEQLATDIQSTFLSHGEFATVHNIDGRNIWVVLETDQEGKHIYNAHSPDYAQGNAVVQVIFFADPNELGYRPEEDQAMRFDGRNYLVVGIVDEVGLYKITLEGNRG